MLGNHVQTTRLRAGHCLHDASQSMSQRPAHSEAGRGPLMNPAALHCHPASTLTVSCYYATLLQMPAFGASPVSCARGLTMKHRMPTSPILLRSSDDLTVSAQECVGSPGCRKPCRIGSSAPRLEATSICSLLYLKGVARSALCLANCGTWLLKCLDTRKVGP